MCFGKARLVLVADPSTDEVLGEDPVLIPSEEHHVSYAEILIKIIKSRKRKNSNALSDMNYDDDHDDDTTVDGQELSESNVKLSVSLANPTATATSAAIVSWHSAIDDKYVDADSSNDYQFTFDSSEGGESPFEVFDKSIASDAAIQNSAVEDGYLTYIKELHQRGYDKSFNVPLPLTSGGRLLPCSVHTRTLPV